MAARVECQCGHTYLEHRTFNSFNCSICKCPRYTALDHRRSPTDAVYALQMQQQEFLIKTQLFVNSLSISVANEAMGRIDTTLKERLAAFTKEYQSQLEQYTPKIRELVATCISEQVPIKHQIILEPDGRKYEVSGTPHKKLPLLIRVMSLRLHTMLVGPAGSGKSTAAEQAAAAVGLPYYEKSMGPQTSQWDLVGYLTADGKYVPGAMRRPYEHGGVFMLDEIDNSNSSILTVCNSATGNDNYTFPDCMIDPNDPIYREINPEALPGTRVKRHPDFVLLAAGNTYGRGADRMYVGRQQLDAATLDRFAVIDWDYDEDAEFQWAGADMYEWTKYVQSIRYIVQSHLMRVIVSPRASINGATMLRNGIERDLVEEMVLWKGISADDRNRIQLEL